MKPPLPANEAQRIEALRELRILDTPPEQEFDDLTALAAAICHTPIALISLVDTGRQWFKSRLGVKISETARDVAFCAHALEQDCLLVVPDATGDPRFCDNPFVTGDSEIRFYAGAPLITATGETVGTLCVLDHKPRQLTEQQTHALGVLSRQVMAQMQMRRQIRDEKRAAAALLSMMEDQMLTERALRESERKLQESEERWQFALAGSDLGVWDWDIARNTVYYSDRWCAMLGHTREEISTTVDGWSSRVHPDDREAAVQAIHDHREGRTAMYVSEHRLRAKDGTYLWTLDRGKVITRDANGNALRMVGTQADITERKTALIEAERQTALLHEAQTIAKLGSWEMNLTNGRLAWSPETCELFGIRPEEFGGTMAAFLSFVLPEDIHLVTEAMGEADIEHPLLEAEYRIRRGDGAVRWMYERGKVVQDSHGRITQRLGVVMDITERKRIETLLAWESRVLEAISAGTPLANVLDMAARGAEQVLPSALASILLVQGAGTRLRHGAAPNLPPEYVQAVDAAAFVGPAAGSCGTAAFLRKAVAVSDIATDPLWENYRELALRHGLKACWSNPVMDRDGRVLATFALYYRHCNAPQEDDLGVIDRFCHIVSLAVERDRKDRELRESEERFRRLSEATNDAIWDWDIITNQLWWNDGFTRVFGYAPADITPSLDSWVERLHPADRDRALETIHTQLGTGSTTWSGEYRFLRRDGEYAYVRERGHIIRDADGKPIRVVGGMTDLTQQKRSEEMLREQATLLDKAQDAIVVRDLNRRILFWNHSAERLYGWKRDEVIGSDVSKLLYRDLRGFEEATRGALENDEWMGEIEQWTKSGKPVTVEGRWTLVRDESGAPKSILAINTDVTEKKRLESQFLRAQRMESIGTLAGGIAHDLNNVLAPIMMAVQVLQAQLKDEESKDLLQVLDTSAQRGADLVRQVLSFARGMEGRRMLVDVGHIARELEHIIIDTFPKNIQLRMIRPQGLWTVSGDPTQLHQVLMNLCVNARDAMPDGGRLSIELSNVELDEMYANLSTESKPGPYLVMKVEDTGLGMPPSVLDKIFEPFFTTKQVGEGTGLGLSTTLAIVRSHGGFINVYSELGKGTKFKIYIPANVEGSPAQNTPGHASELPHGSGETILVVDDEDPVRSIARRTLERFGYKVLAARNGAEAVALYAQHGKEIAVVLTDMAMPVMDGIATITALRAMNASVKVVGSSGLSTNQSLAQSLGSGLKQFIPKPYTAETLLKAIAAAICEEE